MILEHTRISGYSVLVSEQTEVSTILLKKRQFENLKVHAHLHVYNRLLITG